MRSILFLSLLMLPLLAISQVEDCDNEPAKKLLKAVEKSAKSEKSDTCPDSSKVKHLCMYVGSMTDDTTPLKNYRYVYQRKLLEAACADPYKDSEEVIAQKVSKMWKQFESQFICNSVQFDVSNGSIIKFAITKQFDAFLYDIIDWKVNLNRVDETDGRTVLDYLRDHMIRTKGSATERQLKIYYDQFRKAGAKHKSEL